MKRNLLASTCLAAMLTCVVAAQLPASPDTSPNADQSPWVGVWQANLDDLPAITLTLAEDAGSLGGTVVFNIVSRNNGPQRVLASQPHVLLNPHIHGNTLTFQAKRPNGAIMNITVTLSADGNARIHCLDCSPDAPVAEMIRAPLRPATRD